MKIVSSEQGLPFEVEVVEVQPTEKERTDRWGRDMFNIEEYCKVYELTCRWFQTTKVVALPPPDNGEEMLIGDEWVPCGGPIVDLVLLNRGGVCVAGSRYPVVTDKEGRSYVDSGDASCDVSIVEG